MGVSGGSNLKRNQLIASALFKHFGLDPKTFPGGVNTEGDAKSCYSSILNGIRAEVSKDNNNVMKWITFADSIPVDTPAGFEVLNRLNEELVLKSVLAGNGLKPSEADVVVFSVVHSSVIGLPIADRQKLPHLMRWMDYIQNKENFGDLFEKIVLEKPKFDPLAQLQGTQILTDLDADFNSKLSLKNSKIEENAKAHLVVKKMILGNLTEELNSMHISPSNGIGTNLNSVTADKEASNEKKTLPEKEAAVKDQELSVSLLKIQVGLIRKAWKHPSADSLLVEEIDVGDAKLRQVVSGLAKYYSPDTLVNRLVVLITNVKPGKLRDVMSEGLVLCASNEDHTKVEPLLPPEGSKIGESISFFGIDGKPEDVLNPKKKQLEKITPHLFTDENGVATFKGIPFMTSCGACKSSLAKASIK